MRHPRFERGAYPLKGECSGIILQEFIGKIEKILKFSAFLHCKFS